MATAGDVNHDGYSDVLVSAPEWDNDPSQNLFMGKVYFYVGTASGLSPTVQSTAIGLPPLIT